MSSNDKTLADVQPGGRVRLGDQEEPSFNWKEGVHDETSLRRAGAAWENLMYEDSAGEYTPAQHDQIGRMLVNVEQMMEGHPFTINEDGQYVAKEAALSAQPSPCETLPPDMRLGSADYLDYLDSKPSPGGQDALASLPLYRLADDANGNRGLHRDDTGSWVKVQDVERALAARQPVGDQHPDDLAVDAFAAAMKAKMAGGRAKGRGGWNDPEQCTAEDLSRMLRDHVDKGDPRDVANFCMMLHQRGEAIAVRQPVDENYEIWAQNAENVAAELTDERAIKALRFAARGIRSAARHPVRIYGCCAQPEGELHTADCPNMRHLVARQPVSESPMAKMAAALRGKAEAEKAAFDQRVQSGEWGPMPDQYDTRSFCAVCDGSGWKDASENELCPVCEGQGIGTSLAARQPVGEPVAYSFKERVYRTALGHVWTDRLEGALPDSELREVKDVVPLYAAPAQAVDLERVRQLIGDLRTLDVKESTKNDNAGFVDLRCYWALLGVAGEVERSMADSQAVGE